MKVKVSEEKKLLISRGQMLEIRRMDHNQLNGFITEIYQRGIDAGRITENLSQRILLLRTRENAWKAFTASISAVKGIGDTRKQELRMAFRANFGREDDTDGREDDRREGDGREDDRRKNKGR